MSGHKLHRLQVTNFRNLNTSIVEFSSRINCIFGNNGNGKTNLLEAIYVLLNKKSFRKNTGYPQYLSVDGNNSEILINSVLMSEEQEMVPFNASISNTSAAWMQNGKKAKNPGAAAIFINPFDSYSYHNQAQFRRHWFDLMLGLLNPIYKKKLAQYGHCLKMRNSLLKSKTKSSRDQILAIDEQMAQYSCYISNERAELLKSLKGYCAQTFQQIFSENHLLEIELKSDFLKLTPEQVQKRLKEQLPQDEILGRTHLGIHRDDYLTQFDGFNSYEFCSLGQQKMSYLSLIFAYIELFRYKFKAYPIVLIDDVSGELDTVRWNNLIQYLSEKEFQVMITTANQNFQEDLLKITRAKNFYVEAGHVSSMN
ncbi:MAG: DNA replication and repair protein RecF [Bacteriovoracaceae bacterium]|nr:DNA replication and repair protein RecF [Bacteriovoracaceae bacterium]